MMRQLLFPLFSGYRTGATHTRHSAQLFFATIVLVLLKFTPELQNLRTIIVIAGVHQRFGSVLAHLPLTF